MLDARAKRRLFIAWYACIAGGFVLLGLRAWLLGAAPWTVALRGVIAVGFALLAWKEWRRRG
jgi:CHASE2 domain-containing sensor protein